MSIDNAERLTSFNRDTLLKVYGAPAVRFCGWGKLNPDDGLQDCTLRQLPEGNLCPYIDEFDAAHGDPANKRPPCGMIDVVYITPKPTDELQLTDIVE